MAGHSKWKQIQHKKALTDAKRGQLFSKLTKEIIVAAREGGINPQTNFRLKAALERARSFGMPKENIERSLEKLSGDNTKDKLHEFLYEVIGPGGVHVLVDGITDNTNRALAEIKQILTKHAAKQVTPNSLLWNFDKVWTNNGKDYHPKNVAHPSPEDKEKLKRLIDELLEHNDVQEVYTNLAENL